MSRPSDAAIADFRVASIAAGYGDPPVGLHGDALMWQRDADRFAGWQMARAIDAEAKDSEAGDSGWLPIESVPESGEVLLATLSGGVRIDDCRSVHSLLQAAKRDGEACWYMRWRPLPPPPQKGGE